MTAENGKGRGEDLPRVLLIVLFPADVRRCAGGAAELLHTNFSGSGDGLP